MLNLNGNHLPICEFVGFGISHSAPEFIVAGAMHNHTYKYQNGQWLNFSGGDGGDCEVNWMNPSIYYYQANGYMGSSNSNFYYSGPAAWFIGMEYELHPNDPYRLYFGRGRVSNSNAILGMYNEITDQLITKSVPIEVSQVGAIGVGSNNNIYVADFIAGSGTKPNRFIKSVDNGNTWIDLSGTNVYDDNEEYYGSLGQVIAWKTIEDIVINPHSPSEIWISIGGVRMSNGVPESGKFRVLHSLDFGSNWYDYSENLPAFPVMALEFQLGSLRRLFAGTDAGVYYRDETTEQWECFSEGLPISIITDLDYEPCSKYLYASAYSRSLFKTYVPFDDNPTVITNTNEIWDEPKELANDLIILTGTKLTITSDLYMATGKKIVVKPGGELIVDNGRITNRCGHSWQGIQVWGDKNESQQPMQGEPLLQGKLTLNNATIENAIVAVDLWKPDDYSTTGGIVYAEGSTFKNNAKSVHAVHYRNFNPYYPEIEWDYFSNFKYCTFEITDDYLGDETFYKHVDLAYVKGIDFYACDFSVNDEVEGVSTWNSAIAGYDAKFGVKAICNSQQAPCPEEDYDRCTFTGFYSAVSALKDGTSTVTFSVNRAEFVDNAYGVKARYMNNASVLHSDFEIGHLWDCGAGIYSDNVTGFAFEDNDFSKYTGSPNSDYFGIIINNSEAVNEVFGNDFEGLSYANFSDGKNWRNDYRYEGLAYFCNENTTNYADFYVADYIPPEHSGIQSEQGNDNYTAGNTFSQNGAVWHFYNGGEHLVGYYYNQNENDEIPADDKIYHVAKVGRSVTNNCNPHYDDQLNLVLSAQQRTDAEQVYYNNLTDYNSVKALYDSYVDGGDTEGEKLDIQTAQPDDMWELRTQLLGDSPHLSFEVLKEAADKTEVFTESTLFDILAANPDELKKDTLISYLENKEEPLPEYMIDLLKQLAEGTTYKTALQQQMAGYKHAYTRAAHDIIRSNLNDTVVDYVELRNWLDNLGGITSDRQIISSYISEENFTDAFTLANMLPQLYNLQGNELTEHNYYMDLLNLHQTLYQEGRNTFQLDSTEKANLVFIANNSTGVAGAQAKSILEGVYNEYYVDCPEADGTVGYKSSNIINPNELGKAYGLNISVKPNPAKQWAAFDYSLPVDETEATITITNATGSTVAILEVSGQQGQKLWDTRGLKPGVYIYTIKAAGFSQSGKIVISR